MDRKKFIYYAQSLKFVDAPVCNEASYCHLVETLSPQQKQAIHFMMLQDQILQKLISVNKINVPQAENVLSRSFHAMKSNKVQSFFSHVGVTLNDLQTTIQQNEQFYNDDEKKVAQLLLRMESSNKNLDFDYYQIIEKLGSGGMATVYKAYDSKLQRYVAIKKMHGENDKIKKRFLQEAQITAKLKHQNIIAVHEICPEKNYIVMDFVDGKPLTEHLKSRRLSVRHGLEILRDVANAIHYAHNQKVIHRDLKPDNIMIENKTRRAIVMDFGIAKNTDAKNDLTKTGEIVGTPRYMAPEQFQGKKIVGKQTDVYALGAILYELLTGKNLVLGKNTMNLMYEILNVPPIPPRTRNPRLSVDLETICLKAVEKSPQKRYVTAAKFAADIDSFLKGEVIAAKRRSRLYVQWQNIKKRKSFAITVCALLLLIGYLMHRSFFAAAYIKIIVHNSQQQVVTDAKIRVNGVAVPPNKFVKISAGFKKFVFTSPSYQQKAIHKRIYPGEKDVIKETLVTKKGFISLGSVLENVHVSLRKDMQSPIELVAPIRNHALNIGKYTITFSKQNYFSYTVQTEILHDKIFHHNIHLIPMLMWTNTIFQQPLAIAIASSDIDKDGFAELIYGDKNGDLYCFSLKEQKQLWKITSNLPEIHSTGKITILDVNRDGTDDIVWAHYTEFSIIDGKTQQRLFHLQNWWGREFVFANANDDVYPDLILFPRYQGATCHDIFHQKVLWQNQFIARRICNPRFRLANEIIVTQGNYMKQKLSGVISINVRNGHLRPLAKISGHSPAMDYNAKENLYTLFYPSQGLSLQKINAQRRIIHQSDSTYFDEPQFFDIDNDNNDEIILFSDKLYAFDTKKRRIKYMMWDPKDVAFTRNDMKKYILDINKDGIAEVVCVFDHVVTISNYKSQQKSVVLKLPERILGCVFVDTNNDNILDIVCLSAKTIYCFSCFIDKTHVVDENTRFNQFCVAPINQQVIVANAAGNIQAFDAQNWQELWNYTTKIPGNASITAANILDDSGEEVVVHHDKVITLLKNGKKVWESNVSDTPSSVHNVIAVSDQDRDGTKEIYSGLFFGGIVCLKATTGKLLWSKNIGNIQTKPHFADVDGDGNVECILLSSQGLYAIDKTGKTKWKTFLGPQSEGPAIQTHHQTIIVGQKQGVVSCVNGTTGRIQWQKKIPCSMISAGYLIDIDNNGDKEYVCTTIRGKLIALHPQSGHIKWMRHNPDYRYMIMDQKHNRLYVTGSTFTIAKVNAQGYSYDHVSHQGIISGSKLHIADLDNNGKNEFIYINEERRLVCVYNWFEKKRKQVILCYDSYTRKFLHDLQQSKSLPHMSQRNNRRNDTNSLHAIHDLLQQRNWSKAQQQLSKLHKLYPQSMEIEFLQLMVALHTNNKNDIHRIVRNCIKKSVLQFEALWQKYDALVHKHRQLHHYASTAIAKTKTYAKLEKIYWGLTYSHGNANEILPILAKYDMTKNKKYRTKYKNTLFAHIDKNKAVYTQYIHIEIIERGIKQLVKDDELSYKKSLYQFIYNYDTKPLQTSALIKKMPVEKQALGYALLALSFAHDKTHLKNFSRLNLQKDSLLYKIYGCIAHKTQKDIENTFQQHSPQISQNPFYSYIFQILRQRRSR
ncbi:serine/threonine-protein kinase [Candidatus Uabimicrobium amorphum]|uniref:Protein kinase n=1 Tax=Uabimicrobium amorphum TaxID=2596890 RepID=A0A5S9F7E4_UABAM|nr:serine/threonine-protein kinase [Candidatus Uabimicrobium amorphum]BBM88113.1 protein kinase [Candidatus Uabimicrobium amorphum]